MIRPETKRAYRQMSRDELLRTLESLKTSAAPLATINVHVAFVEDLLAFNSLTVESALAVEADIDDLLQSA